MFINSVLAATVLSLAPLVVSQSASSSSVSAQTSATATAIAAAVLPTSTATGNSSSFIKVNALVGLDNQTALQCWQLQPQPSVSNAFGSLTAGVQALGNFTDASLVFYYPTNETNSTTALHTVSQPAWYVVLSGRGTIRFPGSSKELSITAGDLFIANDTAEVASQGHEAVISADSVILTLPVANGTFSNVSVVNNGSCIPSK